MKLIAPKGYAGKFAAGMASAERKLGRRSKVRRDITVTTKPGTRKVGDQWCLPSAKVFRKWIVGITSGANVLIVTKPDGKPNPREAQVIEHECAHLILNSNGVASRRQHEIMRKAGISVHE